MARRTCRPCSDRGSPQAQAASILAQLRQAQAEPTPPRDAALEDEEPMNRYIYAIPRPLPCPCGEDSTQVQGSLEQILEQMACQNQLLVDLLGAVNALTAAMLGAQSRP